MNPLVILELTLFFVLLIFVFQTLQAIDFSKIFKKVRTGQIQITYAMVCVIMAYLLSKALMNIIYLSMQITN